MDQNASSSQFAAAQGVFHARSCREFDLNDSQHATQNLLNVLFTCWYNGNRFPPHFESCCSNAELQMRRFVFWFVGWNWRTGTLFFHTDWIVNMKIHFQINQKVCDEVPGSGEYVGQPQRGLSFSQRRTNAQENSENCSLIFLITRSHPVSCFFPSLCSAALGFLQGKHSISLQDSLERTEILQTVSYVIEHRTLHQMVVIV